MPRVRRLASSNVLLASLLVGLVASFSATAASASDILEWDWARESSPNFTVLGPLTQREARDLVTDLELFRQVVLVLTGTRDAGEVVPTHVVAVEDARQWSELGLPGDTGGVFIPTWRENWLALKDHDDPLHLAAAKHGYVHFLIAKPDRRDVPLWYEEGFADLLSTVQKKRDRIAVGLVPDWVEKPLAMGSWIPVRKLIAPDDPAGASNEQKLMFRAESWALVHYLMVGGTYDDSFTSRLDEYLKGLASGVDSATAFESAFDVELAILDQALHRYAERKRFPALALPTDRFQKTGEIRASRPSQAEVAVAVGRLRAALHENAGAQAMFERAIALDPKNAGAHAALGESFVAEQRIADAQIELDRAAALAPDDATIQLDLAALWLDRAAAQTDPTRRTADVEQARTHLGTAWKLDQNAPETYAMLGRSHVIRRDDPARAIELLEGAERSLAADPAIQLLLADAYLLAGRDSDAAAKLRAVATNPHASQSETQRASDQLAGLAARQTGPPVGAPSTGAGATTAPAE